MNFNLNSDFQFHFNSIELLHKIPTFFCFTCLVKHFFSISPIFLTIQQFSFFWFVFRDGIRRWNPQRDATVEVNVTRTRSSLHYSQQSKITFDFICHVFLFDLLTMKINIFIYRKVSIGPFFLFGFLSESVSSFGLCFNFQHLAHFIFTLQNFFKASRLQKKKSNQSVCLIRIAQVAQADAGKKKKIFRCWKFITFGCFV